jgi:hypothetical protein
MLPALGKACEQISTNSLNHSARKKSLSRPVSAKRDRFRPF